MESVKRAAKNIKKKMAKQRPGRKARKTAKIANNPPTKKRMTPRNPFEAPKALRNTEMDTYRKKTTSGENLPAELQFQLSKIAPDVYTSPFVENGNPLDIPTQKIVGSFKRTFNKSATSDPSVYGVVFNVGFPAQWYESTSGLNTYSSNLDTTVYTLASVLSCESFSSVFGAATYYDKLYTYATVVDCELVGAEATVSGLVHVGSISLASFDTGVSIAQLIQQADKRYDCKDPEARVIRLRTAISNRAAIHSRRQAAVTGTVVDMVKEEYISYAIYDTPIVSLLPVTLPETSAMSFSVQCGVTAQAIWWPEGQQPLTKGLALASQKQITEAKTSPVDAENASWLERLSHFWSEPTSLKTIVSTLLSKKSLKGVMDFADRFVPGLGAMSNLIMSEHSPSAAIIEDDVALLRLQAHQEESRLHYSSWTPDAVALYDAMCNARDDLITVLLEDITVRKQLRAIQEKGTQVITQRYGVKCIKFLDEEGRELDLKAEYQKFRETSKRRLDRSEAPDRPKSTASSIRR